MAPHTTGEAIKGAIYTAALLEELGMEVSPKWDAPRTDLVQTVTFGKPEPMIKFCAAIQHNSPMNAFVDPVPSYMDGYEDQVIMASGVSQKDQRSNFPLTVLCVNHIVSTFKVVYLTHMLN